MEYKVIIDKEGSVTTDVISRGTHKCEEIINVAASFGTIIDKKSKDDNVPVHDRINIRGN